jgi:hypothetical protein
MVRKLILLLIPFIFIACASDPAPAVTPEPELRPFLPRPEVEQNPKIEIDLTKHDSASITVVYSADTWAFINAVILKNSAGEEKTYRFKKPSRSVRADASILEICVYTSLNYDDLKYADDLRQFVAVGDVTARPLADDAYFDFMPVKIKQ